MLRAFVIVCCTLFAGSAWAQTDSSADAPDGFLAQVEESPAVILRVPINERGEEDSNEAVMRMVAEDASPNSVAEAAEVFSKAIDLSDQPTVEDGEIVDGSTQWGWNNWRYSNNYYNSPYYYYNYNPYYYYGGSYYNYGYPSYYTGSYYRYYYYYRYY